MVISCVQCSGTSKRYFIKNTLCQKCYNIQYYQLNKEKTEKSRHAWNKQNQLNYNKKYYQLNKEKIKNSGKIYRQKHNKERLATEAKRRATKLKACPAWANLSQIKKIYKNTPLNLTVDHIIPLQNKEVCGLHVSWNLQYLTASDNCKKNNKFDGTYANEGWRV